MRAATLVPRSARSSTSSMSSSIARSSLRLVTRSATAVPSEEEVRFSPLESRRHQLNLGVSVVVSFMEGVLAVPGTKRKSCTLTDVPGLTAEEIQARVLHRDGLMLVIDKPAGLPVHRGPKGGANLESSFESLRFGLPRPPVLAHRLDKDTSGCLVLGRHRKATASLGLLFKHGRIGKTYWAVVEGGPSADEGRIDLPLGRLDATRGWWMKPDPNGLPAATAWRVLGRSGTDGSARIEAVDRAPHPEPLPGCGETGKRGWTCGGIVGDHPAVHRSDRSLAP